VKTALKPGEVLREGWRSALLGALCGYLFLAYFYLSSWVTTGTPLGWNPIVNGFWGVLRNLSAALFFHPAVGFVAGLVVGALSTIVTGILHLDEDHRRTVGVVAVAVTTFAVLGLPWPLSDIFTRSHLAVGYAVNLLLGVGFVWAALRAGRAVGFISHVAGYVLSGAAFLWVLFALVFQVLFVRNDPPGPVPPGPNVVVFLCDALRADVTSLYGGQVPMPNLERLAARGVTFERCFSTSSWTIPSVVTLFTGLAPEVSGMDFVRAIPPRLPYLPEQLSRRGYRTWCMMANPLLTQGLGFNRGFDHYGLQTWRFYGQGFLERPRSLYDIVALGLNRILFALDYERLTNLGFESSLEMLRSLDPRGGDFAFIHIYDPHAPYVPPKRFMPQDDYVGPFAESSGDFLSRADELSDEDVARLKVLYEAEVRMVDEVLGRALDVLDDRGLWENTVFIFLADHGEEFREHGLVEHFHINLQHELTHVPLVVFWPGRFEGGGKSIQPVGLADVYATILDGLGIFCDEKILNGRSLLRPLPEARPLFAQRCMDENGTSAHSDFAVRGEAALFVNYDDGVEELYVDYYSNRENVAGDNPDLVSELKALITGWHERNAELMEHYGTGGGAGAVDPAHLEQLRAVGYIQ